MDSVEIAVDAVACMDAFDVMQQVASADADMQNLTLPFGTDKLFLTNHHSGAAAASSSSSPRQHPMVVVNNNPHSFEELFGTSPKAASPRRSPGRAGGWKWKGNDYVWEDANEPVSETEETEKPEPITRSTSHSEPLSTAADSSPGDTINSGMKIFKSKSEPNTFSMKKR